MSQEFILLNTVKLVKKTSRPSAYYKTETHLTFYTEVSESLTKFQHVAKDIPVPCVWTIIKCSVKGAFSSYLARVSVSILCVL